MGILLPAIILGYFLAKDRYEREFELRVRAATSHYAEMLASAMTVPLWNLDVSVAEQFVQAVMRNPEVVRVTVEDESKNQFVHNELSKRRASGGQVNERAVLLEGRAIGKVTVELSTGRIKQDLIEDFLKLGAALIAQVVISFVLIWFLFEQRIVAPLQQLLLATLDLARGKLDKTVVWTREDEIGRLAQGLDKMRQNLGSLISERDVNNAQLRQELNERLRAEQALQMTEKKFAAIFHASPVAISVFRKDTELQLIDVNDTWVNQFGWSRDTILSSTEKQLALWHKPEDLKTVLEILDRWQELQAYEAWLHCGDIDKNLLCQISGRLIKLGDETLIVLVQEDISQKRRNEQEILNLNSHLEQRVSDRTQALEVSNQELTIAIGNLQLAQKELLRSEKLAALGSLVAGIAHELNTPIGNSVTVASTMQEQTDHMITDLSLGLTRSKLEKFLNTARSGNDILLRNLSKASELVSSFKQVAVDQSSAKRRVFTLDETVAEIVLMLSPMLRKSKHQLISIIPPKISMDSFPGALGQVITNLINNSLIHAFEADDQGIIKIEAKYLNQDTVEIVVSDNGKGIPEENINRIFDPFFTTKLGQGGSGLGLNIVYNLVSDILGGKITVSSTLNQGSHFSIIIPIVVA
ncbi:ATP-binding protein [Undibacterium sp.]|uniref:ATP-binding protein n=1 Tax=Undibacterium sp. TaxID=1914977 RepID=UPI0025ECF35B|nr:ATP-binding protein [Undibacterium sp.]